MSVCLSLQDDSRWNALITHTFREWSMVGTVVVDFVRVLGKRNAVLALLIRFVLTFAFLLYFCQIMLKAFMFHVSQRVLTLSTVHASLTRRVITGKLDFFH